MGVCGRFIDSLNDEQRDRLVRAQRWAQGVFYGEGGERCLVGHAVDHDGHQRTRETLVALSISAEECICAFSTFDRLVARFGLPRIVRAVKLRAGASVEELAEPEPEPVS